jgi:hypothetical protein
MYPIVKKRYQMREECYQLADEIETLSRTLRIKINKIEQLLLHILTLSLANETRANSSQTWSYRKSLLTTLKNNLVSKDLILLNEIKNNDVTSIAESLTKGRHQLRLNIN